MKLTRRGVLTGAAVGGGLLVAWMLYPRHYAAKLGARPGEEIFNGWIKIAEDGVVTVALPQLEMGQGVSTVLPQLVAVELGADWRQIAVEPAPISGAYANVPLAARWASMWMPLLPELADDPDSLPGSLIAERFARSTRFVATADGTSLEAHEEAYRNAAASARALLAMAAARRWGVGWEECEAREGFIWHGERKLRFAELASEAARLTPPDPPPLHPAPYGEDPHDEGADRPAFPRIDLPSKVDGSFPFAGDIRLPGMVHAAIRHGPIDKAELVDFNPFNARGIRGLVGIVKSNRWLAVAAQGWWAAERALDAMKPRFRVEHLVDSSEIERRLDEGLRHGRGHLIEKRGDGYASGGDPDFARRYEFEPMLQAPIETASATARMEGGRLELWIATQASERARVAAARAVGLAPEDVVLYPVAAGGSFDARLDHDHAAEVALIARELGRPVQLTWSRWQEILRARPRPPAHVLVTARLGRDEDRRIEAMKLRICSPSANIELGRRLLANKTSWAAVRESAGVPDPLACEGAMPPYAIDHVTVEHVPVEIGLPCGRMRSNAHGCTVFARECFIDEIARQHGLEPLSYRMAMLGSDPRLAQCLQSVARLADWGGTGRRQGLACHRLGAEDGGARIACIAEASAGEGGVRVRKISAVADIGRIVNLDIARQQIEGGLVFALAMATGAPLRYSGGLPLIQRLGELRLPRLADCPEIEVEFIASEAPAADPGELGAAIGAAAIANAFALATGLRLRRLPLLSEGL